MALVDELTHVTEQRSRAAPAEEGDGDAFGCLLFFGHRMWRVCSVVCFQHTPPPPNFSIRVVPATDAGSRRFANQPSGAKKLTVADGGGGDGGG